MSPDREQLICELALVRCRLGDPRGFEDLVDLLHEPLHGYVCSLVGRPAADDVLQDVWLRIFRGIGRVRDASALRGWAFSIARRSIADRLRQRYRSSRGGSGRGIDALLAGVPALAGLGAEELLSIRNAVRRLPPLEREALVLFHVFGRSVEAVAEAQGAPLGTIKSRLSRGRRRLAADAGEEPGER